MKKSFLIPLFLICVGVSFGGNCLYNYFNRAPRSIVILSTNDMHANIKEFAGLATAIEECRDTAEVVLVDAGDRWTGNAYVDLVEHYAPIYELMNHVGYDLAIYGNHEFDKGQAYLAEANKQAEFEILGANIKSDTVTFPQPPAYKIIEKDGFKIGFVGVVGNYNAGGHPAGLAASYKGVTFIDPQDCAAEYSYLKDECDMLILVTHMGLERDREFLESAKSKGYDMVIGAHSHDRVDEEIDGKLLGQTQNKLKFLGVTRIERNDNGEYSATYENIPLGDYKDDEKVGGMVAKYYDNEELNSPIAELSEDMNFNGLCNLFLDALVESTQSDIALYNVGGVRINNVEKGSISIATILNMEPFSNEIATMEMTPAQLRTLIMTKFNDKKNMDESHCIDIVLSTPYQIVVETEGGDAIDVKFSELKEGKKYKVAAGSYTYKSYEGFEADNALITDKLVASEIQNYVKAHKTITPNNKGNENIVLKK